MFRFKRSIRLPYDYQGQIYFTSRRYAHLPAPEQARIRELCEAAGGQYADALFAFVTTDATATAICMRYSMGRNALYRVVKRYYEAF